MNLAKECVDGGNTILLYSFAVEMLKLINRNLNFLYH